MKCDVGYAQEHFDELLALVDAGEYVEITRPDGKAVVMLTEQEYVRLHSKAAFHTLNKLGEETGCFSDEYRKF